METEPNFWASAWAAGRIGFHRPAVSPELQRFADEFGPPGRVFVPLCGKTLDLAYLAEQGHTVVGVELVPQAIEAWIAEGGHTVTRTTRYGHPAVVAGPITLLCADIFTLDPAALGPFTHIWDRAARIALPPPLRPAYTALLRALLAPGGRILQQILTYDQTRFEGPPFSVSDEELFEAYGDLGLRLLLEEDGLTEDRWRERLDALDITTYRIGGEAPDPG